MVRTALIKRNFIKAFVFYTCFLATEILSLQKKGNLLISLTPNERPLMGRLILQVQTVYNCSFIARLKCKAPRKR